VVLEKQMQQPDFWLDTKQAKEISQLYGDAKLLVEDWQSITDQAEVLFQLAKEEGSDGQGDWLETINKSYQELLTKFDKLEVRRLLSAPYDDSNVLLSIHAGAGGTDAQDWAQMLQRMYLRFSEDQNWSAVILDKSAGQEAGLKSCLIKISGRFAYGYLKCEAGVHRLVRISPFDGEKMRHTSFALVEVLPELPELTDIKIKDSDLRVDTFMSSGAGGQSVNTTYSAVRLVHLPTNITVTCQNERSQLQNKETALKYLTAKLWQVEQAKQQATKQELRGEFKSVAWGNQVRSYVLHPYKMVKDHRTELVNNDPDKVLDGYLDDFISARLKQLAR